MLCTTQDEVKKPVIYNQKILKCSEQLGQGTEDKKTFQRYN
jgi:hypothetical protein